MAYIPRSPFIPKEAGAIPMQINKRRTVRIFSVLATLCLFAALSAVVGTYFYTGVLEQRVESAKQELSKVSNADNEIKMEEIRKYDTKLKAAKSLLENHIDSARIFSELEASTKQSVQYTNLEFTYDPGYEALLKLKGATEEYSSVALQKMQLFGDDVFTDFAVTNITSIVDDGGDAGVAQSATNAGGVTFNVTGLYKKGVLEYTGQTTTSVIQGTASAPITTQASATTPVATTPTTPPAGGVVPKQIPLP